MAAISAQYLTVKFDAILVGGVKSISGLDAGESSEIDVTNFASVRKEYRQGLADSGTIDIELLRDFADVGQIAMYNARNAQLNKTVVITFATTPTTILTFTGFVKKFGVDAKTDDVLTSTVSIRISGAIVQTAGV